MVVVEVVAVIVIVVAVVVATALGSISQKNLASGVKWPKKKAENLIPSSDTSGFPALKLTSVWSISKSFTTLVRFNEPTLPSLKLTAKTP